MPFSLQEYLKTKADPENLPEPVCDGCGHAFKVYLEGIPRGSASLRLACERCSDLVIFRDESFYGLIDFDYFEPGKVHAILERNLRACPEDGGRFIVGNEIYCPKCHQPLGDWVWSYYLISKLGDLAFESKDSKEEYLSFWKQTMNKPFSLKKITEKAFQMGREGKIRLTDPSLAQVKREYYFVSRFCYYDGEMFVEKPGKQLFQLVAWSLEKEFLDDEEAMTEPYLAAFSMAKLAGQPFEILPGLSLGTPRIFSDRKVGSSIQDQTTMRIRMLVDAFKLKEKRERKALLPENEKARLDEMQAKIIFWKTWWQEHRESLPEFPASE